MNLSQNRRKEKSKMKKEKTARQKLKFEYIANSKYMILFIAFLISSFISCSVPLPEPKPFHKEEGLWISDECHSFSKDDSMNYFKTSVIVYDQENRRVGRTISIFEDPDCEKASGKLIYTPTPWEEMSLFTLPELSEFYVGSEKKSIAQLPYNIGAAMLRLNSCQRADCEEPIESERYSFQEEACKQAGGEALDASTYYLEIDSKNKDIFYTLCPVRDTCQQANVLCTEPY